MEKNIFIKIPNYFVKSSKEGNGGLLKEVDNKLLLVASYLYLKKDLIGESSTTLEDIILETGYKPKAGEGKNNEIFKKMLIKLQNKGLISGVTEDLKLKELIKIKTNFFETDDDNKDICFFIIDYSIFRKIVEINNVDKAILYNLYCYIKSCIKTIDKNIDQVVQGGNYPVAYPSYQAIAKNIGINEGTIKKYLDILVENKLILFGNAGVYSPVGNKKAVYESNNTYIIYKNEESVDMLKEAIKFYKNRLKETGYVFKKNYKTDNRVIGGKMTAIKNKIKAGTATKKDYDKLEELEAICNKKNRTEIDIIKNLLENKKIISEYYYDIANEKAGDKYTK
ncbi:hypothetical protein [Clostridium massiliamazoniense]|uniref:hypothetical protein n=1 Tax=Clostridium massiliamazoniense TaxID=1347366 RepID=UPI0006D8302B|nr:hypothetical protein [Clostridium massiliamazoniense]